MLLIVFGFQNLGKYDSLLQVELFHYLVNILSFGVILFMCRSVEPGALSGISGWLLPVGVRDSGCRGRCHRRAAISGIVRPIRLSATLLCFASCCLPRVRGLVCGRLAVWRRRWYTVVVRNDWRLPGLLMSAVGGIGRLWRCFMGFPNPVVSAYCHRNQDYGHPCYGPNY